MACLQGKSTQWMQVRKCLSVLFIQDRNAHSLWMWQSLHHEENPMHTPVKVVLLAAPNMRCWVNSLASLYWVRPSLLSSSLFSVVCWARDVVILLRRSRLRLCSEVMWRAQHRMTCAQWSIYSVASWLVIKSYFSCSCARSHPSLQSCTLLYTLLYTQ